MVIRLPAADTPFPLHGSRRFGFLNNHIRHPRIQIGDYTYYENPAGMQQFVENVLYHFPAAGDSLVIGRFCSIATGVQFLMNGGRHRRHALANFPFELFDADPASPLREGNPSKGDLIIGHDVWLGRDALCMPGVTIGDGAIVATRAVVSRPVPAYAIVAGNPARIVGYRFAPATIDALLALAWWHWPEDKIARNAHLLGSADIDQLCAAR